MLDELRDNWEIIAEEVSRLPMHLIFNGSTLTREQVATALCKFGRQQWVSGWDGHANWLNWGIAINYTFPLGNASLPKTVEILKKIEGLKFASISLFHPGVLLPLHQHEENDGLSTVHLGLNVPERCFLNVGGKFIKEKNGKLIVFDGRIPHYAFNASKENRFILHCEIKNNY